MSTSQTRREFLNDIAKQSAAFAVPACVMSSVPSSARAAAKEYDILITGGTVVVGTGAKRVRADVGIRDGKIIDTGQLGDRPAKIKIDAKSRVIAPGFIDMHTHSDRTLLQDGSAQSAIRQGATTHVIGNCGSSPAPLNQARKIGSQSFRTYGEYLQALGESGISINVCGLVGHNTIRSTVMGVQDRKPTETEFRKMKDWAAEAMRGGAVGMSTGLVSPPGTYSETDEIVELAKVISSGGGIYASHIRGEAGTVVDAVREAIEIGKKANIRVEISHHKSVGKENWGKTKTTLPMIEKANRRDRPVRCDVYPYRAGSAGLAQLVPPWAHEGGRGAMLDRLSQPGLRKRIERDITEGTGNWPNFFVIDWNDIQIVSVSSKANQKWIGRKVADVARSRGCSGAEACIDLLLEERGSVGMINFVIDEKEMHGVLKHPLSMVGSDGSAISPEWYRGSPHPRFYGCFPRVIGRYCRDLKLFDLETAIKKMTSMPAKHLHLNDRGVIRSGYAADIVIFDFEKIIDKATFSDPHQYPVGIDTVIVNGKLVIHGGDHTDLKPGRVLRPDHA